MMILKMNKTRREETTGIRYVGKTNQVAVLATYCGRVEMQIYKVK